MSRLAPKVLPRCIAFALLVCGPAFASSAEIIQDPEQLRTRLKAIADPAQLDAFLGEQEMFEPAEGDVPVPEKRIRAYRKGAGYDLFAVNLFGSEAKEAVLQLRFGQIIYLLVFFERAAGGWRRVPGVLAVSDLPESACNPERCPGYFCLDFAELRRKGENAIVGRTCATTRGFEGGDVETLWIWEVGSSGARELTHVPIRESVHTRKGPEERRIEYRFSDGYPKELVLRDVSSGKRPGAPTTLGLPFSAK